MTSGTTFKVQHWSYLAADSAAAYASKPRPPADFLPFLYVSNACYGLVGSVMFGLSYAVVRDPDYLTTQRTEQREQKSGFDSIGLSLLVITMVCWEVMLSKGEQWDWLGDPFGRVQTLAIVFTVALVGLILWELRRRSPVVNFRPMRERNFVACCVIIFFAYAVLYGASTSLPGLLQSLFGYNALKAGLVMSPAGLFAILAMPVVAVVLRRKTDARWVIIVGLLLMAAGNYWMSLMNLDISPGQIVWPRVATVAGLAICFAPVNVGAISMSRKNCVVRRSAY